MGAGELPVNSGSGFQWSDILHFLFYQVPRAKLFGTEKMRFIWDDKAGLHPVSEG